MGRTARLSGQGTRRGWDGLGRFGRVGTGGCAVTDPPAVPASEPVRLPAAGRGRLPGLAAPLRACPAGSSATIPPMRLAIDTGTPAAGPAGPPLPVVLLHGQPGSPLEWAAVVAQLGRDRRVLVPTRPGY